MSSVTLSHSTLYILAATCERGKERGSGFEFETFRLPNPFASGFLFVLESLPVLFFSFLFFFVGMVLVFSVFVPVL